VNQKTEQNKMKDYLREKIYLAALLHDIGKFYQRASGNSNATDSKLSAQTLKIEDYICPKNYKSQRRTHKHVLWTNEFLETNLKINKITQSGTQIFKTNPWKPTELDADNIINLASNHHSPQSDLQKIVQLADWWSSGMDRVLSGEDDKEVLNHHQLEFKNFRSVPLFSMFNSLRVADQDNKNTVVAYSIKKLGLNKESVFPSQIKQEDIHSLKESYSNLWEGFNKEFDQLPTDSFNGFEESLYYLLKKFTWAIPSNTQDMANISLFDHSKTTAAIADCLYAASKEKEFSGAFDFTKDYDRLNQKYYPLMMLGIDLSGIQSFIYDIASKKAAQSLKGRSFYLQLLMDSILQKFKVEGIWAKSCHILYAAGGKAYMLLPNTKVVKNLIFSENGIKEQIEEALWKEHKGKLSVNIASVGFAYHFQLENNKWNNWVEVEGGNSKHTYISDVWKTLSDGLNQQKDQKFKSTINRHFDSFFDENNNDLKAGGDTSKGKLKICAVTGEEITEKPEKLGDGIYVTPIVKSQTDLGKTLKDADFIIAFKGTDEEDKYLKNRAKSSISILGKNYYLFDKEELADSEADFRTKISSVDVSRLNWVNELNFLDAPVKGNKVSYGFEFYGGNQQAYDRDENGSPKYTYLNKNIRIKSEKTFEQLAKTSSNSNTLLGILRMDIDNLGNLFIKGLNKEHLSLSTYSAMSFQLDLFFSGYLNTIRDKEFYYDDAGNKIYKFRDWLNILYSGGDDLFVVGRWDKAIEFAHIVRERFANFIGRDDISISGGIAFVHEKFPISKAALMAGDAETASKQYDGKNAITFFGTTVHWGKEFCEVKKLKNKLVRFTTQEKKPLSKAIIHKLILYNEVKDKHIGREEKNPDYSFLWHTAYYLKRYVDKYDKGSEIFSFVMDELQTSLFESSKNNFRYYELAALAARWAEMELKYLDKPK